MYPGYRCGALVVLVACDGGGSDSTGATGGESGESGDTNAVDPVTVELPPYPIWENDTIVEDPALLDELAAGYTSSRGDDDLEMERFLFGVVPVAAEGTDSEALSYAEASLFPANRSGITDGLAENFGYNQGYMLQILEAPPEGFETPEQYEVTCVDEPFARTDTARRAAVANSCMDVWLAAYTTGLTEGGSTELPTFATG